MYFPELESLYQSYRDEWRQYRLKRKHRKTKNGRLLKLEQIGIRDYGY